MDTQIKLSITTSYPKDFKPETIDEIIKTMHELDNEYKNKPLFEFKEYAKVCIYFDNTNEDAVLEVESYYSDNLNGYGYDIDDYNDEYWFKELLPGDTITLSPGGDDNAMLVPGTYTLVFKQNGYKVETTYSILPHNMENEYIYNMRDYLENTISGLSYNIYQEKLSSKEGNTISDLELESYKYLYGNKDRLLGHMRYIINNPIEDLNKLYRQKKYTIRPTVRSIRWKIKKDGNNNKKDIYYEKHCETTRDITENKYLKYIITKMQSYILDAECEYNRIDKNLDDQIARLHHRRLHKKEELVKVSRIINTSNIEKKLKNEIKIIDKDISENRCKQENIKYDLRKLSQLKSTLNFYVNDSWISEIDCKSYVGKISSRFIKNIHYYSVYKLYNELTSSNTEGANYKTFPYKKTSQLFEIYCFLITKEVFEDLGFIWTGGWIKSSINKNLYDEDLKSGDYVELEKDEYKIVITYDKYLNTAMDLNREDEPQIVASEISNHRRPDILITLYKNHEIKACKVIEVKYRGKRYLFNKKGVNTNICNQLISYLTNLEMYDPSNPKVSKTSIVDKVLTLYPKQGKSEVEEHERYDILFVPILPCLERNGKYEGYEIVCSEVIKFLNKFGCKVCTNEIVKELV